MQNQKKLFISICLGILCSVPGFADLFISEYIEGSSYNKALEIYNPGTDPVDLGNDEYRFEVYFNGNTTPNLNILLEGILASGDVYVVAPVNVNAADFPLDQVDLFYGTAWFNGDDAVVLRRGGAEGEIVDSLGQVGYDPGSEWGSGLLSTQNNTLRRLPFAEGGDTDISDPFDPAPEWEGFTEDTFTGLGYYTGEGTPGPTPTPSASPTTPPPTLPPTLVPIYQIQGQSHLSPHSGEILTTKGIVTLVTGTGFYLQDSSGDNNPLTSDGILVYTGSPPGVSRGDEVLATGQVSEYTPGGTSTGNLSTTEIYRPSLTVLSGGNPLPQAVLIGSGGWLPPTTVIDDDQLTSFDPATDGIDFYECLEGMLVEVEDALAVSPLNSYGEVFVVTNRGAYATGMNSRGGLTVVPEDFNPERIQLQLNADLLPGFSPQINTRDLVGTPQGVMDYNYGNYEILVCRPFDVSPGMLTPLFTNLSSDRDTLRIATYNVENLDPNDEDGDSDVAEGKFSRLADQIVNSLDSPDILALQEIQDNDGATDSGEVEANATYQLLIREISLAGGPAYDYLDSTPLNNRDGGQPGANIRVGFLYNPRRVSLQSGSLTRIGDESAFNASRKSLAATFLFNSQEVTVINNHFASKSGGTPLFGARQPPVNGKVEQREAQAAVIKAYVDTLLEVNEEAYVVVLGDLNEFSFYSPLAILKGEEGALTDLEETLPELERYTYNYRGNSQALDHIFISPQLLPLADFEILHLNSEFCDQVSDHDPELATFYLPAPLSYSPGDVDHNGRINVVDAYLVLRYSLGNLNGGTFYAEQADVNKDGKINCLDALLIIQYSIGLCDHWMTI